MVWSGHNYGIESFTATLVRDEGVYKTKKDLKADTSGPKNVTNAVFVGSTAELQKLMKGKLDNGD